MYAQHINDEMQSHHSVTSLDIIRHIHENHVCMSLPTYTSN